MHIFEDQDEQTLLNGVIELVQSLPGGQAAISQRHPAGGSSRIDAVIDVAVAERSFQLLVEIKREAFPRSVPATQSRR